MPIPSSVYDKLARGDHHRDELFRALKAYIDSEPFTVATRRDPDTNELIYFLSKADEMSPIVAMILGDALHNYRGALDHLALGFAKAINPNVDEKSTEFPIREVERSFTELTPSLVGKYGQQFVDVLSEIGPWKEKAPVLWALHQLNNFDKHRRILSCIVGHAFTDFSGVMAEQYRRETQGRDVLKPRWSIKVGIPSQTTEIRQGHILCKRPEHEQPDPNLRFEVFLLLHEPDAIRGRFPTINVEGLIPVIDVVDNIRQKTRGVVERFAQVV